MVSAGFNFAFGIFLFILFIWFIGVLSSPIDEFDENSPSPFGLLFGFFLKYVIPYLALVVILFSILGWSLWYLNLFLPLLFVKAFYRWLTNHREKKNQTKK